MATTKKLDTATTKAKVAASSVTPLHQWTHRGDKVLLVKCTDKDGKGYQGFPWPKSGKVASKRFDKSAVCDDGGLYGWAWGLNLGGGKSPDYSGCWIVFAADPSIVVEIDDGPGEGVKCKAAGECEVVYFGDWAGALAFTMEGRLAWLNAVDKDAAARSRGAASNSGDSGAASNSGDSGAASNSGDSGAASNSGYSGAASNSGDSGAASNSGYSGAASNSGDSGAAVSTGEHSTVESAGIGSIAASTAQRFIWVSRPGAVLLARWVIDKTAHHKLFVADDLGLTDGQKVVIQNGEIVKEWTW